MPAQTAPTQTALAFRTELNKLRDTLLALPPSLADVPWRAGGWTRKQIVGHLLDSAANNRQRFVRAAIDGQYAGPGYAQDAWVALHGYAGESWETLLRWWQAEHEILMAAVNRIPEERLEASCVVGDDDPVTLRFLIEDYVHHQQGHFKQLQSA
jgi:DinB superfamily